MDAGLGYPWAEAAVASIDYVAFFSVLSAG
jgi:hypothetical protein